MATPPRKIYLQWDDAEGYSSTWAPDEINSDDVEYIRTDIVNGWFETLERQASSILEALKRKTAQPGPQE